MGDAAGVAEAGGSAVDVVLAAAGAVWRCGKVHRIGLDTVLIISTSTRSTIVNRTSAVKNCHSSMVNPSWWASGERNAHSDNGEGGQCQHETGPAAEERHPPGADREDDQRLGGKRFHEPAGAELDRPGVQHIRKVPTADHQRRPHIAQQVGGHVDAV